MRVGPNASWTKYELNQMRVGPNASWTKCELDQIHKTPQKIGRPHKTGPWRLKIIIILLLLLLKPTAQAQVGKTKLFIKCLRNHTSTFSTEN